MRTIAGINTLKAGSHSDAPACVAEVRRLRAIAATAIAYRAHRRELKGACNLRPCHYAEALDAALAECGPRTRRGRLRAGNA